MMAAIAEQTGRFTAQDGTTLVYRRWAPPAPHLRIVVSHGLGEHAGRYGHVVETLVPMGCAVWIADHRGHGRSEGCRGHVTAFDAYAEDLKTMITLAAGDSHQQMPLVLIGHSMGGLIALRCAALFPQHIDGMILSSPLLGLPEPPPKPLQVLATILSTVWPTFPLANRLDASMISHDAGVIDAYAQDPLVHKRVTARWVTSCIQAVAAAQAEPDLIRGPLLFQVAGADRLVSAQATLAYFDRLKAADKTLHLYDHLYHEIYNERLPDRKTVLNDLKTWLAEHYLEANVGM